MTVVVTGGSGSGKSEYAEDVSVGLFKKLSAEKLIYIATMRPFGQEAFERIEKHRNMRKGKGFVTAECYSEIVGIENILGYNLDNSVVLLECMSNLTANEIFLEKNENAVSDIVAGIELISKKCAAFVIVTNEIFSDGVNYDKVTLNYIEALGKINCEIATIANTVVEVVCGIPIFIKGGDFDVF